MKAAFAFAIDNPETQKAVLLLFVTAFFISPKRLRGEYDVGAFKHGAGGFIAKQLDLKLHAGFASTRQAIEIAAQRAEIGDSGRRPLMGLL
ncbi:Uncharacterised protein [Yokenella regensburgei]|nr:Uncharacterised protein [Yokenella regensburgei]